MVSRFARLPAGHHNPKDRRAVPLCGIGPIARLPVVRTEISEAESVFQLFGGQPFLPGIAPFAGIHTQLPATRMGVFNLPLKGIRIRDGVRWHGGFPWV